MTMSENKNEDPNPAVANPDDKLVGYVVPGQSGQPYPTQQPYSGQPPYPPHQPYSMQPNLSGQMPYYGQYYPQGQPYYGEPQPYYSGQYQPGHQPYSSEVFYPRPSSNRDMTRSNFDLENQQVRQESFGSSFGDIKIRHAFIRKVFSILTAMLTVTVGMIALFIFVPDIKLYVQTHPLILTMAYVIFFTTYIPLVCCTNLRRKFPINFIMLAVFTLSLSYLTAAISTIYETDTVLMALGVSTGVCAAVMLFSIQTKCDITGCGGLLLVISVAFMIFLIIGIFLPHSKTLNVVYSAVGCIVFCLFLMFDMQLIMGGRKIELSPEEYICGALELYVDVLMIFLYILSLLRDV